MNIGASNPGVRDGTKLERFSRWEALLGESSSSGLGERRDSADP